jgi:hypothetical protein
MMTSTMLYKLFCAAQRRLNSRLRDLYASKDTYVSSALTRGVNLTWLSEQTGVADSTLRKHYGRFIHADAADALELAKIDSDAGQMLQFVPRARSGRRKDLVTEKGNLVEDPVWCELLSPSWLTP